MNLFKYLFLVGHLINRYKAKYHLENELDFLKKSNDTVFDKTEEELRVEREDVEKRMNKLDVAKQTQKAIELKAELNEIDLIINRYTSIKTIYGKTEHELILMNAYIKHLKKCLKF
jgi:hypothetical protein